MITMRLFLLMNCVSVLVFLTMTPIVNGYAQEEERRDRFVGCYKLELGRWTRFWIFGAGVARNQVPPSTFRLRAERVEPKSFRVEPSTIINSAPSRLDGWGIDPHSSHSVYITWSDGFTGVTLHLEEDSTELRGHATAYTDARGLLPFPSAPAIARRIPCASLGTRGE